MTGAFVRIQRDGKWQAIEIEHLTLSEAKAFTTARPNDGHKWAVFLDNWVVDHVLGLLEHERSIFSSIYNETSPEADWDNAFSTIAWIKANVKDATADLMLQEMWSKIKDSTAKI